MNSVLKVNKNNTLESILELNENKPLDVDLSIADLPDGIEYAIDNVIISTTSTKTLINTSLNVVLERLKYVLQPFHLIIIKNSSYIPKIKLNAIDEHIMVTTHITESYNVNLLLNEIINDIKGE